MSALRRTFKQRNGSGQGKAFRIHAPTQLRNLFMQVFHVELLDAEGKMRSPQGVTVGAAELAQWRDPCKFLQRRGRQAL